MFREKLQANSPKRLLALDGGGIRGVITLEVLARLEELLRNRSGDKQNFVLADYFDYVAGTSTGAIIATCISLGMSVESIRAFYLGSGAEMFSRAGILKRFRYKYEDEKLSQRLKDVIGEDTTLGSEKLRTLLMMVMRNASTDSPWPVCNVPTAKYNDRSRSDCNLDLPLWKLVRASTAAPTYFPPEIVALGNKNFIFVDGGVTTYNNPAFQLFLMTTTEPYSLCWQPGVEKMLLVSIGTGTSPNANANLRPEDMTLLYNASSIPGALMYAALNEQDFLCRVFGQCRAGCALDREVGDMRGKGIPNSPKLFSYMRYNAELSDEGFRQLGITGFKPEAVQPLDSIDHLDELREVGRAVARVEVREEQFLGF